MSFLTDAVAKARAELDVLISDGSDVTSKVEAAFKKGVLHSALTALETDAMAVADKIKAAFDLGASTKD